MIARWTWAVKIKPGSGPQINGPCLHLPGFQFGYVFFTHSQLVLKETTSKGWLFLGHSILIPCISCTSKKRNVSFWTPSSYYVGRDKSTWPQFTHLTLRSLFFHQLSLFGRFGIPKGQPPQNGGGGASMPMLHLFTCPKALEMKGDQLL